MLAAVIPVRNEQHRVGRLLSRLTAMESINCIYVVLNGSDEPTVGEATGAYQKNPGKIALVHFSEPLGIDVPRAVGAYMSYAAGLSHVLFIDGDMVGEITADLNCFIRSTLMSGLDLALVNCYPSQSDIEASSPEMIYFRHLLSRELGLLDILGAASPSHGPHIVSRHLLRSVPWQDFAVPPTLLFHVRKRNLKVGITGEIPHARLGSSIKSQAHSQLIIDTIAGDCLEALCLWEKRPRTRRHGDKVYLGYHGERRFDLLAGFLAGRKK